MIKTYYHPDYTAHTPTASMRKLHHVALRAHWAGVAELLSPGEEHRRHAEAVPLLRQIHDDRYVTAVLTGEDGFTPSGDSWEGDAGLASSNGWTWTPDIARGVLAMNHGMMVAAAHARDEGIAANIAQGFHHAHPERGSGFCTFNGLALVAAANPTWKVAVLDCDEHEGDGTAAFTKRLENLWNFTIYGTHMHGRPSDRSFHYQVRRHSAAMEAIQLATQDIDHLKPDLVIYQAGMDPHEGDPLCSYGATTEELGERDSFVFRWAKRAGHPLLFNLAGGYQAMDQLSPLHVNTFGHAAHVYYDHPLA